MNGKFLLAIVVMVTVALNSLFCLFLLHSRVFDCEEKHAAGSMICSPAEIDRIKADAVVAYTQLVGGSACTQCQTELESSIAENGRINSELRKLRLKSTAAFDTAKLSPPLPAPTPNTGSGVVVVTGTNVGLSSSASIAGPAAKTQTLALPYLIIGLPTVPRLDRRRGGEAVNYLGPTLDRLHEQMISDVHHPMYGMVQVWVMNNDEPTKHTFFESAKQRFAGNPNFVFIQNDGKLAADDAAHTPGPNSSPSDRVRKQTRDVVSLLRAVNGKSHYYLFMEDDFAVCPHTLNILSYIISKAAVIHPQWISIKVGYGLNGLIIKNQLDGDLHVFGEYLLKHQRRRPPDHLSTEWTAGESQESGQYKRGRPHLAYRFNLMLHMGDVSAIRDSGQEKMPECFFELRFPILFEVDAFKKECNHDDMWPCPAYGSSQALTLPPFPLAPSVNPHPPFVTTNGLYAATPSHIDSNSAPPPPPAGSPTTPPLKTAAEMWAHLPKSLVVPDR